MHYDQSSTGQAPDVAPFYKRRGETPKEALTRFRKEHGVSDEEKLSYAGRLDPLAEGLLLILRGEANKRREDYLWLPKRYLFDVLFGWATDTYDIAGRLTAQSEERINTLALLEHVAALSGTREEPYPPFSSKPVYGKPLFAWAREGRLSDINIPTHTVHIASASIRKTGVVSGRELYELVERSLGSLTGDFRQQELWDCWERNVGSKYDSLYDTATIDMTCSSGTYVRSIAHRLGEHMGIPALALRIVRLSVGEYTLPDTTLPY